MTEITISVRGQHSVSREAERATVVAQVSFDGPHRNPVFASATASLDAVRELVLSRFNATTGPIIEWSAGAVRVWSERPWNNEGKQLDPVHHAALDLTARFTDFSALSAWIDEVVTVPGASVISIDWSLSDDTLDAVLTEVRSHAVADAVAKATVYAEAVGLTTVTATAIADPGLLDDRGSPAPAAMDRAMMKFSGGGEGSTALDLKPARIEVSASVDARFVAR